MNATERRASAAAHAMLARAAATSCDAFDPVAAEDGRESSPGDPSLPALVAGSEVLSVPAPPHTAARTVTRAAGRAGQAAAGPPSAHPGEGEQATTPSATPRAEDERGVAGAGAGVGAGAAATDTVAAKDGTAAVSAAPRDGGDSSATAGSTIVDDVAKQAGLSASCTLVWYFSRLDFDGVSSMLELACRPMCILRPGKDIVALPIGFPMVADLWAWAVERFGYQPWQALWYPVKLSTDEHGNPWWDVMLVHPKVVDSVRSMFHGRLPSVLLVPFQMPKQLAALCAVAGVRTFGDTLDGLAIKDCLHTRPWNGDKSVPSTLLRHPKTDDTTRILVPRGFTCVHRGELLAAHAALTASGVRRMILKPSWTCSGNGIVMNVTQQHVAEYAWDEQRGSVVLEEYLAPDVDPSDGRSRWPVVHFLAHTPCGEVVEQLIADTTTYTGTVSPCDIETVVAGRVESTAAELAAIFGFSGFWGIDLLVHKGQPYLIDLNSGRPNGGHIPKIFVSLYAPNQPFKFWKDYHVSPHATANSMHASIQAVGLAFTADTRRGLVVLAVLPGDVATILAIGRDTADLRQLLAEWEPRGAAILGRAATAACVAP